MLRQLEMFAPPSRGHPVYLAPCSGGHPAPRDPATWGPRRPPCARNTREARPPSGDLHVSRARPGPRPSRWPGGAPGAPQRPTSLAEPPRGPTWRATRRGTCVGRRGAGPGLPARPADPPSPVPAVPTTRLARKQTPARPRSSSRDFPQHGAPRTRPGRSRASSRRRASVPPQAGPAVRAGTAEPHTLASFTMMAAYNGRNGQKRPGEAKQRRWRPLALKNPEHVHLATSERSRLRRKTEPAQ